MNKQHRIPYIKQIKRLSAASLIFHLSVADVSALAADRKPVTLEEITVSAQRHEQSLRQVPIAVSQFDGVFIDRSHTQALIDLAPATPGLVISSYSTVNPQLFIRGIGSTATDAGQDSSIAVFIDEVYTGRAASSALEFLDLQRVEILRGPQGTLYGRNAASGAINLVTNKPTSAPEASVNIGYGSFDTLDIDGVVSGPLVANTLYGRLAVSRSDRDGYVTNTLTGNEDLRSYRTNSARGQLQLQLTAETTLRVSLDVLDSDALGSQSRKAIAHSSPLIAGGFIPLAQPSTDIDEVTLGSDGDLQRRFTGFSANLQTPVGSGELTSISAWRNNRYKVFEDVSAVGLILLGQDEDSEQFSQELRWSTETTGGIWWTSGLYYFYEGIDRRDTSDLSPISDATSALFMIGLPDATVYYDQSAHTRSYALFSQADIPLTDRWQLTLGARYSVDKKSLALDATGNDPLGNGLLDAGPFSGKAEEQFSEPTGKLALTYQSSANMMAYISATQGYKAGGLDGNANSAESLQQSIESETVDSYELGIKSSWLQQRLRLNLATFWMNYQDLQVFQVDNSGRQFIDNAAEAESSGAELELTFGLNEYWHLDLNYAYLDTRYREFASSVDDDGDGQPDNLRGNRLTRSPRHSYSLGLNYQRGLANNSQLDAQLSYRFQDEVFITPQNRPLDTIDDYAMISASVGLSFAEHYRINVFGHNLTDEEYKLHTYDADPVVRGVLESAVFGQPRTWGVQLRYSM